MRYFFTIQKMAVVFAFIGTIGIPATAVEKKLEVRQILVSVNGVKIYLDLLEQLVANSVASGNKDSAELRSAIKNELIAREVLAQDATRLALDKLPAAQNQLFFAREGILAELAIVKNAERNPVTDDMLQAEYKRQVALLADTDQFLVSHIVLATEAEALDVLKMARGKEPFEKLAKEKSLDASKLSGGSLGWLLSSQLIQPLANVIVNLNKGAVAAAPIQTPVGWQIIKLIDKRKFVAPSIEESKPQLTKAVMTNQRTELIQKLLKAAKIEDK